MGIDPLASTHKWLERAVQRLKSKETTGWYQTPTEAITNISILNEAFCELLLWNPKHPFPEVNLDFDLFVDSVRLDVGLR